MATSSFPRYDGDYFGPWVLEYCTELAEKGHNVIIIAPQSENHDGPKQYHKNITIQYFKYYFRSSAQKLVSPPGILPNIKKSKFLILHIPFLLLGYYLCIRKILNNTKIDILHSQWAIPSGFINSLISKKNKLPHVVSTLGAELYLPHSHPFSFFTKFVLKRCDVLFAVSEQMKSRAITFGISPEKIKVVPNSVNPNKFQFEKNNEIRDQLGISHNAIVILSIRRLVFEKRVIDLIKAFQRIENENVILLIGGDGPLKTELEYYCAKYGLLDKVYFSGYINSSDLASYYSSSDIYVLSSQQEGLSISLLESMSSGLITISTSATGGNDVIENGVNGFLYEAGNIEELYLRLNHVISLNASTKEKLRASAREAIIKNYSNDKVIDDWLKNYRMILKQ